MRSIGDMANRGRSHLVAQIEKLLAIGEHALVDLEHHRQEGGNEQRLALVAVLGAEVGRYALDLDRRHCLALADIGQDVGDIAKEPGEFVGRSRADLAKLDLAANGVAGGREAAMAQGLLAHRTMEDVVGLAHIVAHEGENSGSASMARNAGCSGDAALAGATGGKDRYGATSSDGNGSLSPTPDANTATQTAGNAYCRPRSSAGQTDDFIPHSSFHSAAQTTFARGPPRTATLQLRCTLDREAAYWAACTSTTSGT